MDWLLKSGIGLSHSVDWLRRSKASIGLSHSLDWLQRSKASNGLNHLAGLLHMAVIISQEISGYPLHSSLMVNLPFQ